MSVAKTPLSSVQRQRLADAIAGRAAPSPIFAQNDRLSSFALPVWLLVPAGLGLYFGQGGSNAAKLIFYPAAVAAVLGVGVLILVVARALGPLPVGRYVFASGVFEIGLLRAYMIDHRQITKLDVHERYGRRTRGVGPYLGATLRIMTDGASEPALTMVTSEPREEVRAKHAAFEAGKAQLAEARARGDEETVAALDPLAGA